jgi:hypothetical protein
MRWMRAFSAVPSGLGFSLQRLPRLEMKCWAIVTCPSGAGWMAVFRANWTICCCRISDGFVSALAGETVVFCRRGLIRGYALHPIAGLGACEKFHKSLAAKNCRC